MPTRHFLAPVKLNGTTLGGIFSNKVGAVRDVFRRATDGSLHHTLQYDRKRSGAAEFKTVNIGAMLTLLNGSTDLPALKMNGTTGYQGYFAKAADGLPEIASGTVHELATGIEGTVWMDSLDWSEGGDFEASLRGIFGSSNGTVEPLAYTQVAAPTIPTNTTAYDLTSATVANGAAVDVDSLSLRFDPKLGVKRHPGSVLARGVVSDGSPIDISCTVGIKDLSYLRSLTPAGVTTDFAFVLTKRANNGGLGSSTVTITLNGEWTLPEDGSASVGQDGSASVLILPSYDGSNKPVTWAVA